MHYWVMCNGFGDGAVFFFKDNSQAPILAIWAVVKIGVQF